VGGVSCKASNCFYSMFNISPTAGVRRGRAGEKGESVGGLR